MNQITINRECARRLVDYITQRNGELDPRTADEFMRTLASAAAGDFAPLAALVGTREVAESAPAHSFREGDVVRVLPAQIKVTATVVADRTGTKTEPGWVRIANDTSGAWYERAESLALTHRRHFKAGERCGTVAVGQERHAVGSGQGAVRFTEIRSDGGFCVRFIDGKGNDNGFTLDAARAMPLAADWSADTAVPCEVKP